MTPDAPAPPIRRAARVIVLDREERILLFRFVDPVSAEAFWITPGGGLEPGESFADAARRELREETGLSLGAHFPCVWERTHDIRYGHRRFRQHERFYLLRIDRGEIDTSRMCDYERTDLAEHRWWSAETIRASGQRFAPARLGWLIAPLLAGELPGKPIDVGD